MHYLQELVIYIDIIYSVLNMHYIAKRHHGLTLRGHVLLYFWYHYWINITKTALTPTYNCMCNLNYRNAADSMLQYLLYHKCSILDSWKKKHIEWLLIADSITLLQYFPNQILSRSSGNFYMLFNLFSPDNNN